MTASNIGPKTEARDALARYLERFPEERAALARLIAQLTTDKGDVFDRRNMLGHITTSALVLDVKAGKVLLIDHIGLQRWLQPGGHYEGLVALWLSALREVAEETGAQDAELHIWTMVANCPFDIDTHDIPANLAKCEGDHLHHDYVYLVTADSTKPLIPQEEEVNDAKWEPVSILWSLPGERFKRICRKLVKQAIVKPEHFPDVELMA